ncbi:MAG: hypothetical protein AW09_001577 [Candidatus Accumulibacter phosphatis]|uniref:Uncharacterized protein n=1 Tax=Candidatus Accumulibacter phosphatis TaxID=327160 RepID=A0A080LWZ9_9PROT|nr:MAG: hypothetical protein AW09_001577 [Candidatus Accumulibacter phosphatis]
MQVADAQLVQLTGQIAIGEQWRRIRLHFMRGPQRRDTYPDALATDCFGDCGGGFQEEAPTLVGCAAIRVSTIVQIRAAKLIEQIAVRGMDLDAVEARCHGIPRRAGEIQDDLPDFLGAQRARRIAGQQHRILAANEHRHPVVLQADRARANGWRSVGAQTAVTNASDMPELQVDTPALAMHCHGDLSPAGDLGSAVNPRCAGATASLRRNRRPFGNDQASRSALRVVRGSHCGRCKL